MMNRGGQGNNAVFYWNEGEDTFKMVTSSSLDTATSIADTALAPLEVGKITVDNEIEITDNEIRTTTSNANLVLGTAGAGTITLTNAINIDDNKIVATRTNDDLVLDAAGTGKVSIAGIKYPTSDGTTGQALVTDGSGNLSFGDVSGGTVQGHQVTLGDFSDSSTQDGALLTDSPSSLALSLTTEDICCGIVAAFRHSVETLPLP
mgnify:CR=1 FL=1